MPFGGQPTTAAMPAAAAGTPASASKIPTGPVHVHALCAESGFAVVKQHALRRQLSESRALSITQSSGTTGTTLQDVALGADVTMEAWVRFEKVAAPSQAAPQADSLPVKKASTPQDFVVVSIQSPMSNFTGSLRFRRNKLALVAEYNQQETSVCDVSLPASSLDSWTHVAAVFSSGGCSVYVNGAYFGSYCCMCWLFLYLRFRKCQCFDGVRIVLSKDYILTPSPSINQTC